MEADLYQLPPETINEMNIFTKERIILLMLLIFLIAELIFTSISLGPSDYADYWVPAHIVKSINGLDIYSYENEKLIYEMSRDPNGPLGSEVARIMAPVGLCQNRQTPMLYALTSLASTKSISFDFNVYVCFTMLLFLTGMFMLMKCYGYSIESTLIMLVFILYLFYPVRYSLQQNNVNLAILGLSSIAISLLGYRLNMIAKYFLTGFLLSTATIIKPVAIYAIMAIILSNIVRRKYKPLFHFCIGSLFAAAIAFALVWAHFGTPFVWKTWLLRLSSLSLDQSPYSLTNFSLPSILNELFGLNTSIYVHIFVLSATIILVIYCSLKSISTHIFPDINSTDNFSDIHIGALGLLAFLLSTNLAYLHYFSFSLPIIIILFSGKSNKDYSFFASNVGIIALICIGALPLTVFLFKFQGILSYYGVGIAVYLSTLLLYIVGFLTFTKRNTYTGKSEFQTSSIT